VDSVEVPAWLASRLGAPGCDHVFDIERDIPKEEIPPFVKGPVKDRYCSKCGWKQSLTDLVVRAAPAPVEDAYVPPPKPVVERERPVPIPLDDIHVELDLEKYGKRFSNNRRKGVVDRAINVGEDPRWNDAMAAAAEQYVALALGVYFPGSIERPDEGWDMAINGRRIQVKWTKHDSGRLIASPIQHNVADYYVLVTGDTPERFTIRGWATRSELLASTKDLGYGTTYAVDQEFLRPFEDLLAIRLANP
jgi:hypothetical protein